MDSFEDSFIYLPQAGDPEGGSEEMTPERIQQEVEHCKEVCRALEQDSVDLHKAKGAVEQRTQELRKEQELLCKKFELQMSLKRDEEANCQMNIFLAREENNKLRQEKEMLEKKLEVVKKRIPWEDPLMMISALPEKKMVFKSLVSNKEDMNKLILTPLIRYPLPGGSALITFEKAEVAQRIIEMKEHVVELSCGDELEELDRCRVRMQAAPVDILLPSAVEIGLSQSNRSILVSDLPNLGIPEESLLDKLELFFSKTKNGGGEVDRTEFLDDSGQVMLTFAQEEVAELLISRGHIQMQIGKTSYNLKISPCISGNITDLQLQPSRCPRTVLLSGIPDVLPEEAMRDTLEIHFQRPSRGGGEVDALAYVPAGRDGVAVFAEDAG
ncbi:interferon-induced 35 kDa protein [Colius striatus]|nr:interferon-induced 35 kDa protein [Colius striatus]